MRNLQKIIEEAKTEITRRQDIKCEEIRYFGDCFRTRINEDGFYNGLFDLIVDSFMFGYGVGKRAGNQKKGACDYGKTEKEL